MTLAKIIDYDQLEELVEQHDRYEFMGSACQRRDGVWYVYHNGRELSTYIDPALMPTPKRTLADALYAALQFRNAVDDGEIKV